MYGYAYHSCILLHTLVLYLDLATVRADLALRSLETERGDYVLGARNCSLSRF